jgi:predicted membrane-bound spermidine synthase
MRYGPPAMHRTIRLTILMLMTALLGSVALAALYRRAHGSLRHTYTIAYDWKVAGATIGGIVGLAIELGLRILRRSNYQFSVHELLVATTFITGAVAVIAGILPSLIG